MTGPRTARGRQPDDWERDLAQARVSEHRFGLDLSRDERLHRVANHTEATDLLDFSFEYDGLQVWVDLKEKRQAYSPGLRDLWPEVPAMALFVLDETVFRRIVWQGGGGYLVIHDYPGERWVIFGPWELTLGPRARYQRWGRRAGSRFLKGKILLDLRAGAHQARSFSVDDLLWVIERSRAQREAVEAVATKALDVPEIG